MSYRNDVAEAKRLVKRSEEDQWRLAELTWTNVQNGTTRSQWANDVGFSRSWARILHDTWALFGELPGSARPSFADAVAKVKMGDEEATSTSAMVDRSLASATPAAVAKAVASNPAMARAIARNTEAREAVQVEAIEVRTTHQVDMLGGKTPEQMGREASHNAGRTMGETEDDATLELRRAARSILEAMVLKEEFGITDEDAEADAIKRVEKALRIYKSQSPITAADEAFLSENGIEMVE